MENNQYEKQEDYIFKQLEDCQTNELWYEIDNDNAKYLYNYIKNLQSKKQQLIKFLEDKIKECQYKKSTFSEELCYWTGREKSYQEVLDFVENGGKDE